jgi:hypothetical protein
VEQERRQDGVLRVGVTGHRALADPEGLADAVDAELDRLVAVRAEAAGRAGDQPVAVELRTSLAEGADRLVAVRVLARGGRLVVLLPLAADDYRQDFATDASQRAFDRLSAVADEVRVADVPDGSTREVAYEVAGHGVVEGSDVLLALWDGQPSQGRGGTAEIVEHARRSGLEVVVIPTERSTDAGGSRP